MARRESSSDVPLEVDVQMRRLESVSCNLDETDPVTREPVFAAGNGKNWTEQGSRFVHRPHDEQIRFADRRKPELDGFQIYASPTEMLMHDAMSELSMKRGPRRRRTD